MEYLKQLSKEEHDEYARQLSFMHSDEKTREACLKYFLDYKSSVTHIPSDRLSTVFRCAFFIAEKSQVVFNLKGEKVRGVGLSLNQFLRNSQPDDLIIVLKDFLRRVRITDADAQKDLNNALRRISFLITFHMKFEKTFQKLELKELISESFGYTKILASFAWLLFIDSKQSILKESFQLIENTCMLAHVIAFMLIYSWDYVRPAFCADKKMTDRREISLFVQEKVLEMFLIKNVDTYRLIAASFEDYFEALVSASTIRMTNRKTDFLSPEFINANYKKLDYQYQKNLSHDDIDERIFFKDRAANLTPSKFTPFARQGRIGKMAANQQQNKMNYDTNRDIFSCNRAIPFETGVEKWESQTPQSTTPTNTNSELRFPKNIVNSPLLNKRTLICSTPITSSMEMYNYLNEKARKGKQANYPIRKFDSIVGHLIDRVLDKGRDNKNDKTREIKTSLIFYLYKVVSQEYGQQNPHERENEGMMRALLVLSAELVFFVSNITMSLDEIEEIVETQRLQQWSACDFFLKFDRGMPSAMKLHLLDLQTNIISFKIWKDYQLAQLIHNTACGGTSTQVVQRCFKRLLHQIAFQITQLCQILKIDDRTSQQVFDTVKYILCQHTQQFLYRHIDLFILCSIFLNCKVKKLDMKFNDIKQRYKEANQNNKALHEQIISNCYMSEDKRADIIKFYNTEFINIGNLREFISSNKENMGEKFQGGNAVLQSPLRAIIPKGISFNKVQQQKKGGKTPQTNLLYAYTESPMIQGQFSVVRTNALNSRKVINFDEEEKILNRRCTEIIQTDDGLSQANEFISKKCTLPNNVVRNRVGRK